MEPLNDCSNDEDSVKEKKTLWNPLLKQLVIGSSAWTFIFMNGLCMGAPTVYIPQIRREANSSDAVTMEMASWLSSVTSYGGMPGVLILTVLSYYVGRKLTCVFLSFTSSLGFIIFYYSNNIVLLLVSGIIQGLLAGSAVSTTILVITEYTSPRYRGPLIGFKLPTLFLGICTSNFIGTFFHWSKIGLIGILCSIYNIIIVLFIYPESPYWLTTKGRFEECARTHRWLKGSNAESEKELSHLLKLGRQESKKTKSKLPLRKQLNLFFKTILSNEVYKPMLLVFLLICLLFLSGKYVLTMYSLDIFKKITKNETSAYTGMLVLDGISLFSMIVGCIMVKILERRKLLLAGTFIGICFLYIISLYLYLMELSIIVENKYVSLILLSGYSLAISTGSTTTTTVMLGELIPIKCRDTCVFVAAVCSKLVLATILKISPYLFQCFGTHGTFLFFSITCSICLILAYKYLIETKNKTLIEILEYFKNSSDTKNEAKEFLPIKNGNV